MLTANGKAICKINDSRNRPGITMKAIDDSEVVLTDNGSQTYSRFLASLRLYSGSDDSKKPSTDLSFTDGIANLNLTTLNTTSTISGNSSYTQDYIGIFTATFRNDTEEDIVVKEIGLMGNANNSGNPQYDHYSLFAREVIDPVTISPGEAYTFTMYIS